MEILFVIKVVGQNLYMKADGTHSSDKQDAIKGNASRMRTMVDKFNSHRLEDEDKYEYVQL